MSHEPQRLRVEGVLSNKPSVTEFVIAIAKSIGMDEKSVWQCELAIDELFTNIVEHGYNSNGHGKFIEVVCEGFRGRLVITLIDEAPPFNPFADASQAKPDPNDIDNLQVGGLGISFVTQLMSDFSWKYHDNHNYIRLVKEFG